MSGFAAAQEEQASEPGGPARDPDALMSTAMAYGRMGVGGGAGVRVGGRWQVLGKTRAVSTQTRAAPPDG